MNIVAANVLPFRPPTLGLIKNLLWTDVLARANGPATPARVVRRAHVDLDTLAYWEFLDRWAADESFDDASPATLDRFYRLYRGQSGRPSDERIREYADAVTGGWLHPAGRRALELFDGYARMLNVPGAPEVRSGLDRLGALLGPAADDLSETGPRMATTLLDLAPALCRAKPVVVVHDDGQAGEFVLLQRVAARHGATLHRLPLRGLDEDPRAGSLADLDRIAAETRDEYGDPVVRLGLRLYFVAVLGRTERRYFQPDLLRRWMRKADRLLSRAENTGEEPVPSQEDLTRHGYVSPYDLTADLLSRRPMHRKTVLTAVYT